MQTTPAAALRALAHPVALTCLVVLILNDHLLKQSWPGPITGKLSDFVGLVVAPLLLAFPLCLMQVRNAATWACGVVAFGFAAVKISPGIAEVVSAGWSLGGFPTRMLADPTDLVALPTVGVALLLLRRTSAEHDTRAPRQVIATAAGAALLPVVVLATAATSCGADFGVDQVMVVTGPFSDAPEQDQTRVLVGKDYGYLSLAADDTLTKLPEADHSRVPNSGYEPHQKACDIDGSCWRITAAALPQIEVSTDSGRTWAEDFTMSQVDVDTSLHGQIAVAKALLLPISPTSPSCRRPTRAALLSPPSTPAS